MKAIKYAGKGRFKVVDVPVPDLKAHDVLVRMKVAGICASDLHIQRRHDARFADPNSAELPTPGHEPAGVVEKVGAAVRALRAGDRVAVYHKTGCGTCEWCREGKIYMCPEGAALSDHADGACADYLAVHESNCLKLPDDVTFEDAAVLMCAGGTAYSALSKTGVEAGETIAIFGLGPVGLSALMFAKARDVRVIAVDVRENRLRTAKGFGADHLVGASDDGSLKNVYEAAPGVTVDATATVKNILELTRGAGADAVLECSGRLIARTNAVDCAAKGGRVVLVGIDNSFETDGTFQKGLEADKIIFKELRIFGSNVFPITMFDEMIDFVRSRSVPIGRVITDKFHIEEATRAFHAAQSREGGKAAIVWE